MKDVTIIGGGVVGLCSAKYLVEAGFDVVIIDKFDFNQGCSYGNAGMIVPSHFTPLASPGMVAKGVKWMFLKKSPFYIRPRISLDLLQWMWQFYRSANAAHVDACAPLLRDMHTESRETFKTWSLLPEFNFEFKQDGILMMYKTKQAEEEEWKTAAMANSLGIETQLYSPSQLADVERQIKTDVKGAVHYPGDATIKPQVLMENLVDILKRKGVTCIAGQEVTALDEDTEGVCTIAMRDGKTITSKYAVVAAGAWSSSLLRKRFGLLPLQDGKGYSMTIPDPAIKPSIPAILHEASVAISPMQDALRISGTLEISGLRDAIKSEKVKAILDAVPSYYPEFPRLENVQVWYGYRPVTPDGMPYIGPAKEGSRIFLATGHAMMGLSLAPATGRQICELITGKMKTNPLLQPFRYN